MVAMRTVIAACAGIALLAVAPPSVAQDAESRIFAAAKTCTGLNAYLRAYPKGRFRTDAQARITKECGATPVPASTTKPASTPAADQCVKARADWAKLSASNDISELQSFLSGAPKSCTTQRTQAQARLDTLQAAETERKRVVWNGVPEFDGVWVLDTSVTNADCGNFPWTHKPQGQYIRRIYGNGDHRDLRVESISPPALHVRENNKGRAVIEGQRMRIEDKDGKLDCYLKRQ
jgi:hypothetical protein